MIKNLLKITSFLVFLLATVPGVAALSVHSAGDAVSAVDRPVVDTPGRVGVQNRCDVINNRIQSRIGRFNENKDKHIQRYENLKERFLELIQRLEERGYDVSKLGEDASTLDDKIGEFASEYATFIYLLEGTQSSVCGESEGAFVGSLAGAREQLQVVRGLVRDIKEFYRTVIREDILALKAQNPVGSSE
jgi:hypothetical protein